MQNTASLKVCILRSERTRHMLVQSIRRGLTSLEVLSSATILLGLIGVLSVSMIRTSRLSKETRLRFIALQEVSNELQMSLERSSFDTSNDPTVWAPSQMVQDFWPEAKLERQFFRDESGDKVQISMYFDHAREIQPLRLVGWKNVQHESHGKGDEP